ncbi:MAG TPA: 50S ribosomal protein L25 [Bacteroidales bacterium]|nr:50S ribosomal protein L25 [Bacteroidales bacterium]
METIELSAALRTETGKKAAKQSRKAELVPAVIYGDGENTMISLSEKELKKVIYTPVVYLVKLNVDGKVYETIIKEIQFHPVTDKILHVDFLKVSETKPITIALPVNLVGQAEGVKAGGKLLQVVRKIRVIGLVNDLPDTISIDVTHLGIGKSIMVSELSFDKFTVIEPKSMVIATIKTTRAAREVQQEPAK